MIDKKTLANIKFTITWEGKGNFGDDEEDALLFAQSIKGYIELFNKPPKRGMCFENGNCDTARIGLISYNGINNTFWVDLSFDL